MLARASKAISVLSSLSMKMGRFIHLKYEIFMLFFLTLLACTFPKVLCIVETCVDVKFEIFTGSGIQDYYSGDHFWYNITMTNSGTTTINTTFTVTARNATGGVFGAVVSFKRYLEPNDTTILYPNYTRLGKDEVFVYFMDTAGTYTMELSCDVPMSFYRYYTSGGYTVEHNRCHISIDAMPSYQRLQNERWNQYLQENENYMNKVQVYIDQSRAETKEIKSVAIISVTVAVISIMFNLMSLSKAKRKEWKGTIYFFLIIMFVILVYFIFLVLT